MLRKFLIGSIALALTASMANAGVPATASTSQKGSLLIYPKIELKWQIDFDGDGSSYDPVGDLVQDTFVTLSNDGLQDIEIILFYVDGDPELDASSNPDGITYPGWVPFYNDSFLTKNQPSYWSAATGNPGPDFAGLGPFYLDLGPGPGRPDMNSADPASNRVSRGYLVVFAVDFNDNGAQHQMVWNHLYGDATIVNYLLGTASEYTAWAFRAYGADRELLGDCGDIEIGSDYDYAPGELHLNFYADGNVPDQWSIQNIITELTLHLVDLDVRQETQGPGITKATFFIHNQEESSKSADYCVNCWISVPLGSIASVFKPNFLQSDMGKARIDGLQSFLCPGSSARALLGVSEKKITFLDDRGNAAAATNLVGSKTQSARILFDCPDGPGIVTPTNHTTAPTAGQAGNGASVIHFGRP